MAATHTISLVREHFLKHLSIKDVVNLLKTDKTMSGMMFDLVERIPDNQKMMYHFTRILKRPYSQRRSSFVRITLLGDLEFHEDIDGLHPRDRVYGNVYSVTMWPNPTNPTEMNMRFETADYLTRFAFQPIECYLGYLPKREWRKIFGADIQQVSIEYMGWNHQDILNLQQEIMNMLESYGYNIVVNLVQVPRYIAAIDSQAVPY